MYLLKVESSVRILYFLLDWTNDKLKRAETFSKIFDAIILSSFENSFIAFSVYKIIPEFVGSNNSVLKTWWKKVEIDSFDVSGQELR